MHPFSTSYKVCTCRRHVSSSVSSSVLIPVLDFEVLSWWKLEEIHENAGPRSFLKLGRCERSIMLRSDHMLFQAMLIKRLVQRIYTEDTFLN